MNIDVQVPLLSLDHMAVLVLDFAFLLFCWVFVLFCFVFMVWGLELRVYSLSHSSALLVLDILVSGIAK
jgi:hypothetical protein